MISLEQKLKNPAWFSLQETHNKFSLEYNGVRFYNQEICPFGSFLDTANTKEAANEYAKTTDNFFFVSGNETPVIDNDTIVLDKKIDGCQMVLDHLIDFEITEHIVLLTKEYLNEIYDLIWLVMPGYYRKRSFEMGNYYGIFKNNKLVAIAGQRMQTDSFIEISGVVTHPDYTRKGLAKQLVVYVTREILKTKKLPILHTNKGNPAIKLYEKIGFRYTRDMNWFFYRKK